MPDPSPRPFAAQLFAIRLSFLLPPLVFGALAWQRYANGGETPHPAPRPVELATLGIWCVATVAVMVLRRRYAAAKTGPERRTNAILGWAAGEIAALAGAAKYYASGDPQRFFFGLFVFAIALLLFPIPRDDAR